MATRYLISEQILHRLRGMKPDTAKNIRMPDIMLAIGNACNGIMNAQFIGIKLPSGETLPDASMAFTFENVAVEKYRGVARAKLPLMPVTLPRNMGVEIFKGDGIDCTYVPMLSNQWTLYKSEGIISDMGDDICYELTGGYAEFKKDITELNVSTVAMRIISMDINSYTDHQLLPIPPDYEAMIIEQLIKQFSGVLAANNDTDLLVDKQKASNGV